MKATVLDTLYAARQRLASREKRFEFTDWAACTCGHIYAAGYRDAGDNIDAVHKPREGTRYAEVILAAARALGYRAGYSGYGDLEGAAVYVSDKTRQIASDACSLPKREHAIEVVDRAIAELERGQERDRLDVLAQAAAVVDAVEVGEPVTA